MALAREALAVIIRFAGQAPSRFRPLSSNVRAHANLRFMLDTPNDKVLLAHVSLIRMRGLLWLAAILLAVALVVGLIWQPARLVFAALATVAYLVALGFAGITGNHLGQVGIKYPLAALAGSAALSGLVMPLAGVIAPVAVFFWLKEQVGAAYRAQQNHSASPRDAEPAPQTLGEP